MLGDETSGCPRNVFTLALDVSFFNLAMAWIFKMRVVCLPWLDFSELWWQRLFFLAEPKVDSSKTEQVDRNGRV